MADSLARRWRLAATVGYEAIWFTGLVAVRSWARLPWGLCLGLAIFIWFGLSQLSLPGPYGDEVLQAAPAAQVASGTLPSASLPVALRDAAIGGKRFPFMAMNYVGPVKTYLLALSFSLLGPGVESMRATTVLVGTIGLIFLYLFARMAFDVITAELGVLLVGTDPSFVLMVRDDWGPVAIAFSLKVLGLYASIRAWRSPGSRRWPWLAGLFFGLGMSHKDDFAWFLIAALPVSILLFSAHRRIWTKAGFYALFGFLIGAAPLLLFEYRSGGSTWSDTFASLLGAMTGGTSEGSALVGASTLLSTNFARRAPIMLHVLDGQHVIGLIVGYDHPRLIADLKLIGLGVLTGLASVSIAGTAYRHRSVRAVRSALACLAMVAIICGEIIVTPLADGSQHSIAIYPFLQLFVAFGLSLVLSRSWLTRTSPHQEVAESRDSNRFPIRASSSVTAVTFLTITIGLSIAQLTNFETRLSAGGGRGQWSDSIVAAGHYLATNHAGQYIQTVDWGLANGLIMVMGPKIKIETWLPAADASAKLNHELQLGHRVFVLHAPATTTYPAARSQFYGALQTQPGITVVEHIFPDRSGGPSVVVVEIAGQAR